MTNCDRIENAAPQAGGESSMNADTPRPPARSTDVPEGQSPWPGAPYIRSESVEAGPSYQGANDMNAWQAQQDAVAAAKHDFLKMEKSYEDQREP